MGGLIIFFAAAFAFAFGVLCVMTISAWRRTREHRAALINALTRIDELERVVSAMTFGMPPLDEPRAPDADDDATPASAETPRAAPPPEPNAPAPAAPARPEPVAARVLETAAADAFIARLSEPARAAVVEAAPVAETAVAARVAEPARAPRFRMAPLPKLPRPQAPHVNFETLSPPRGDVTAIVVGVAAFLALAAVRVGAFTPIAGVGVAALFGVGAIAIADWRRRQNEEPAPMLALAGLGVIAAALIVGRITPDGVPPILTLLAAGALGFYAIVRASAHGPWLYPFGVACALLAPLADPMDVMGGAARSGMLVVVAALACSEARARHAAPLAWVTLGGAMLWAAGGAGEFLADPLRVAAHCAGLVALAAIGLAYGWNDSANAASLPRPWRDTWREGAVVALFSLVAASAIAAVFVVRGAEVTIAAPITLVVLTGLGAVASVLRPRLAFVSLAGVVAGALAVAAWPQPGANVLVLAATANIVVATALAAGAFMIARGATPSLGAALAALTPVAMIVAAQARAEWSLQSWAWAAIAVGIAAAEAMCAVRFRAAPAQRAAFVMGGALAVVAALGFLTPAPWPPVIVALAIPALAYLDFRFAEAGLRAANAVLCGFLLLQLGALAIGGAPLLQRAAIFTTAILATLLAARFLADAPQRSRALDVQAISAVFFVAIGIAVAVEGRLALAQMGGDLRLFEAGLYAIVPLVLACLIAHRSGEKPRVLLLSIETALFAIGGGIALFAGAILINPWWGLQPASVAAGWPAIAVLYLVPGLLCGYYAWRRGREGYGLRVDIALGVGLTLLLLELTLDIRRVFHPASMTELGVFMTEGWAYVVGWLGFAAALLVIAQERQCMWLRYVSLGLGLAALAKAAIFDLAGLQGAMPFVVFALLAATGVGLVYLYRRFVFPQAARTSWAPPQP